MVWVLLVLVAGWSLYLGEAVRNLSHQLDTLRRRLDQIETAGAPGLATEPLADLAQPPSAEPQPAPLEAPGPETRFAPEPDTPEPDTPELVALEPSAGVPVRPSRPAFNLAAWLSEHGLAWLGGGALVLGGVFLVAYAARRGLFTPPLRIAAAVALGAALMGVGEWLRRREQLEVRRGAQIAAIATGAGAATLYAAVWASERLYHFIGLEAAALLLAAISGGLLALAWRQDAALAILALGGACLTPMITGRGDWAPWALGGYLALIGVTGYGAAALRRWFQVGLLVGGGLFLWTLSMSAADETPPRLMLILLLPALALAVLAWRRRQGDEAPAATSPAGWLFPSALAGAVIVTLDLILRTIWSGSLTAGLAPAGLAPAGLAGLTALALARRHAQPPVQALAQLGLLATVVTLAAVPAPDTARALVALGLGALAIVVGICAALSATAARQGLWSAMSAVTAVLIFALCDAIARKAEFAPSGVGAGAGAALLTAGVLLIARRSAAQRQDLILALWIWAAAALTALAAGLAASDEARPSALAAVALTLVLLQARLGWRGLSAAALAAGVAALGGLLHPDLIAKVFQGDEGLLVLALAGAGATALLALAARLTPKDSRDTAEAMSSLALTTALAGAFILLANLIARKGGHGIDAFLGAGLRGLLLFAAGFAARRGAEAGAIARWRPHVLTGLGAAHLLLCLVLVFNPLWSGIPIAGPPVLDALALGFLAPALFLAAASRRAQTGPPGLAAAYAAAGLGVALIGVLFEIRRLAQGPDFAMALDALSRVEAAADGLVLLVAGCALLLFAARSRLASPQKTQALAIAAATALTLADLCFFHLASPWWGPVNRPLSGYGAAAMLGGLYLAGAATTLGLARLAGPVDWLARLARASAALQMFVFTTLAVRLAFRGLEMSTANAEARIETWAFSFVWAVYGVGVMILGLRQGRPELRWTGLGLLLFTTAKVLLFDMARLDGVVRAASFLALGALLLVGAQAARRFSRPPD